MNLIKTIDVGKDYSDRLTFRTMDQAGSQINAEDFREKYLSELDKKEAWKNYNFKIVLDFSNVDVLSPSFANTAFAYFAKYAKNPEDILDRIIIQNASRVKYDIIMEEIRSGFGWK